MTIMMQIMDTIINDMLLEVARKAINKGFDVEVIADITGLDVSIIRAHAERTAK